MIFQEFSKIARLSREIVITEKIDGTNGQIFISDGGLMLVGSRTRWLSESDDNYGFFKWCNANAEELRKLGPGRHFGEWWGQGIQRNYGMKEKIFSLFNVHKWADDSIRPACCRVVPTLWKGIFDTSHVNAELSRLKYLGSMAAPGFMKPEGVVIFHTASGHLYKKTIEKDEQPKGRTI